MTQNGFLKRPQIPRFRLLLVVGRVIKATIGRDHHANFFGYLEAGGILGLVEKAGMGSYVTETVAFDHGVSQLAVLSRA
jgi:hypothetical protein